MPSFTLRDVEQAFRAIAAKVRSPVVASVLGGAALARWDIKASTRDVDLVFRTAGERHGFESALESLGASRMEEHLPPTKRRGARRVWVTVEGLGWDLFVRDVMGFLLVSSDYASAQEWLREGHLEVRCLDPNLVFVMKAFTPRTRDIGDMADLLVHGRATAEAVEALVAERLLAATDHGWLPAFYHGVLDLGEERGVDVRWVRRFEGAALEALGGAGDSGSERGPRRPAKRT